MPVEVEGTVQCRLATHGWQNRIRTFLGDDLFNDLPGYRFDISGIGHGRVSHDRRRVGVDEDDPVPLFAQRLAGLGSGVVELTRLANHYRTCTQDENTVYV